MTSRKGRIWTLVMVFIIIGLPVCTLLLLKDGFKTRSEAPASSRLIAEASAAIPPYLAVSFRGDTITDVRMREKVAVLNFASADCVPEMDARMRRLYEIQSDYYGKTLSLRILTQTLKPEADDLNAMRVLSERYAGREVWHFLRTDDSTATKLFNWCDQQAEKKYGPMETDQTCPQFVYLIDGEGLFRGAYDLNTEEQFHDLFNDILFLVNKLDLHDQKK